MDDLLSALNGQERDLIRETEPARMGDDEDELIRLHSRIRRARKKHQKNYRRQASAGVEEHGGQAPPAEEHPRSPEGGSLRGRARTRQPPAREVGERGGRDAEARAAGGRPRKPVDRSGQRTVRRSDCGCRRGTQPYADHGRGQARRIVAGTRRAPPGTQRRPVEATGDGRRAADRPSRRCACQRGCQSHVTSSPRRRTAMDGPVLLSCTDRRQWGTTRTPRSTRS